MAIADTPKNDKYQKKDEPIHLIKPYQWNTEKIRANRLRTKKSVKRLYKVMGWDKSEDERSK